MSIRRFVARTDSRPPVLAGRLAVAEAERSDLGRFMHSEQARPEASSEMVTVFIVQDAALAREALLAVLGGRSAEVRLVGSSEVGAGVRTQARHRGALHHEADGPGGGHERDGAAEPGDAHEPGDAQLPEDVRMTHRELEVIDLIGAGLSNKEIAHRLNIASYTVKSHVRNVMVKLALHTRLQIAAHAHRARATY